MSGYSECLQLSWLDVMTDWQQSQGCWSDAPSKEETVGHKIESDSNIRRKREEKVLAHGCKAHKTAVAISAIVQYVKRFALTS